jgi:spore maturation protein CgeB
VRLLILDHYYPQFIDAVYEQEPDLAQAAYSVQRGRIDAQLFGETAFEVAALRELGHEAWDSLVNVRPLQAVWVGEHNARPLSTTDWGWRLRRGFVPWPSRRDHHWIGEALIAQVKFHRPDVVHVQCMDLLDPRLILELRDLVKLVVGQIAAPLPIERALVGYGLVVSSLPNLVAQFRAAGLDAEWLPLAFAPSLVQTVGLRPRDVPLSFVGSLSTNHASRIEFLEAVAGRTGISVWTAAGGDRLPPALRRDLHGPAWGIEMYRVLASSQLTLNHHIDLARGFANNLRLFEATGMGALLLTDEASNLTELFDEGREVVTYSSAQDCAEKAEYFLAHPNEAAGIAAAGQVRTLRDHTWRDRMERLVEMIGRRL